MMLLIVEVLDLCKWSKFATTASFFHDELRAMSVVERGKSGFGGTLQSSQYRDSMRHLFATIPPKTETHFLEET